MITGEHTIIRISEPDDAPFFQAFHLGTPLRAALLDGRREPTLATVTELRELLGRKETVRGFLFTVEALDGQLIGWCGLRGIQIEAKFAELFLLLAPETLYATATADEAMAFLIDRAFVQFGLEKAIVLCLECETALRDCLLRHGFVSCGVQREAVYSDGGWLGLDTLALHAPAISANSKGQLQ